MDQSFTPIIGLKEYGPAVPYFAHMEPWFIPGNSHTKATGIVYDSRDPATISRQLAAIKAMGFSGVNINYYGPHYADLETASHNILVGCASLGLSCFLCPDKGMYNWDAKPNWQSHMIAAMNWIKQLYISSPIAFKLDGKPVLNFFIDPTDDPYLNWDKIRAVTPDAIFLFENSGGYKRPQSNGAYAWVNGAFDGTDIGLSYLNSFYSAPVPAGKYRFGAFWPGFNDQLAGWHPATGPRVIPRNDGLTLLQTLGLANGKTPLHGLICSTWNDHEEGSAIEFGVAQYN